MNHVSRTVAVIAFVVASVLGIGALVALAQSTQSTQRTVGGPRETTTTTAAGSVTPPPLPFGDQSRPSGEKRASGVPGSGDLIGPLARLMAMSTGQSRVVPYTGPRPKIPKLSDMLHHRYVKSAIGSSIVLTGPLGVAYLEDSTVAYGSLVGWICENMQASTNYEYIVFSPDGYAAQVYPYKQSTNSNPATFTTDNQGRCIDSSTFAYYAFIPLSTPMTSGTGGGNNSDPIAGIGGTRGGVAGSDPPYSGVWAIAVKNVSTGLFEAVAYTVVLGTLNFNT
jgi:hypothetical protein